MRYGDFEENFFWRREDWKVPAKPFFYLYHLSFTDNATFSLLWKQPVLDLEGSVLAWNLPLGLRRYTEKNIYMVTANYPDSTAES
jgi:hypothetical protein